MQFQELGADSDFRYLYVCQINNIYGRMVGAQSLRGIVAAVVAEYSYDGYPAEPTKKETERLLRLEAAKNIQGLLDFFGIKAKIVIIDSQSGEAAQQGGEDNRIESINIATDELFLSSLCEIGVISLFHKEGRRYVAINDKSFSVTAGDLKMIIIHNEKFQKLLLKYGSVSKGFYQFKDT